jgi:hypothetical protein
VRRAVIAAVLLAVAAGAVAGVLLAGHHRAPGTGGHSARPPAPAASPAPAATGTPGTAEQTDPPTDLSGLRWSYYHGVMLPYSLTDGPRDTAAGLASGYSDTPAGALIAAVNIGVRASDQWGPAVYTTTIQNQVTGPDAAALLSTTQADYAQAAAAAHITGGAGLGNAYVTEEAYRWVSYSPAYAVADIVSAGPGPQGTTVRASTTIGLIWSGGDWRLIAPPAGNWANEAHELTSLAGYTIFPGQG